MKTLQVEFEKWFNKNVNEEMKLNIFVISIDEDENELRCVVGADSDIFGEEVERVVKTFIENVNVEEHLVQRVNENFEVVDSEEEIDEDNETEGCTYLITIFK